MKVKNGWWVEPVSSLFGTRPKSPQDLLISRLRDSLVGSPPLNTEVLFLPAAKPHKYISIGFF